MESNVTSSLREASIQVGVVMQAFMIIVLVIVVAVVIRKAIEKRLMKTLPPQIAVPMVKLTYYTIITLGVIAALSNLGINLSALLVAGGVAGIVLGFASQAVFSNLLSGLFLYIDRPFTVGDAIIIGNISGIVENITVFSTRVRQWDGVVARIPNEQVFRSVIQNPYASPIRRFEHRITITHIGDLDRAIAVIEDVLKNDQFVLVYPQPSVYADSIVENGVVIHIRAWAPTQYWFSTKNRVLKEIRRRLEEEGIEVSVNLHMVWLRDYDRGGDHPPGGSHSVAGSS